MDETITPLLTFQTVARARSFRKAAVLLKTSPATISRRIAELEARLGVQLMVRTTRRIQLTEIGKTLLANSEAPIQALGDALFQAANSKDEMQDVVRITATYTIAETMILPIIPSLHRQHPGIRIELLLDESVLDIRDKRIDFAIRIGELSDTTLISRKLGRGKISYFRAPNAGVNPPLLSYGEPEFEPEPPVLRVKDMRILHRLLKSGFGGAWLPDILCQEDLRSGALVRDEGKPDFGFDGYLIYHANRFIPRRTRHVMDALIRQGGKL